MCYNCGCGILNDPMGKGKISEGGASLTDDDFKVIAEKWGMTLKETKQNTMEALKSEFDK